MRLVRPTLLVDLNRAGLDGIAANGAVRSARPCARRRSSAIRVSIPCCAKRFPTSATSSPATAARRRQRRPRRRGRRDPLCLAAARWHGRGRRPHGRREIATDDFFVTHYLTTLAPGELVVETSWPRPVEGEGSAFEELALRAGDYALAMVAVVLRRSTVSRVTCASWPALSPIGRPR